jgi:polysaccharide pyruvyl transferase WcaK-like protein
MKLLIGGNLYGAGNIGDDAVLCGIVAMLKRTMPAASITVGSYHGTPVEGISGVDRWIHGRRLPEMSEAIAEHDGLIIGGGTMIADELNDSYPVRFNAMLAAATAVRGRRVMLFGIGANRLHNPKVERLARTLTSLCSAITTRDAASANECRRLGASANVVHLAGDPAFLLQPQMSERGTALLAATVPSLKCFGVNVVNESWARQTAYKQAIAAACDILSETLDYTPVFFSHEIRSGEFGDQHANAQTVAMMKRPAVILPATYLTAEEMAGLLQRFEFTIAMRMHALILSAIAGVPFVAIRRVDKVDNFMQEFGLGASGSVDRCEPQTLVADVMDRIAHRTEIIDTIQRTVAALRGRAEISGEIAKQVFESPKDARNLRPQVLSLAWSASATRERLERVFRGGVATRNMATQLRAAISAWRGK